METDTVVAPLRCAAGASAALLRAARAGREVLPATAPLCLEYEAVCSRPEHMAAAGSSAGELRVFPDAVVDLAEPVAVWCLSRPQLRDPGDELVLEAAVNGQADAIATFNRVISADRQSGSASMSCCRPR